MTFNSTDPDLCSVNILTGEYVMVKCNISATDEDVYLVILEDNANH